MTDTETEPDIFAWNAFARDDQPTVSLIKPSQNDIDHNVRMMFLSVKTDEDYKLEIMDEFVVVCVEVEDCPCSPNKFRPRFEEFCFTEHVSIYKDRSPPSEHEVSFRINKIGNDKRRTNLFSKLVHKFVVVPFRLKHNNRVVFELFLAVKLKSRGKTTRELCFMSQPYPVGSCLVLDRIKETIRNKTFTLPLKLERQICYLHESSGQIEGNQPNFLGVVQFGSSWNSSNVDMETLRKSIFVMLIGPTGAFIIPKRVQVFDGLWIVHFDTGGQRLQHGQYDVGLMQQSLVTPSPFKYTLEDPVQQSNDPYWVDEEFLDLFALGECANNEKGWSNNEEFASSVEENELLL